MTSWLQNFPCVLHKNMSPNSACIDRKATEALVHSLIQFNGKHTAKRWVKSGRRVFAFDVCATEKLRSPSIYGILENEWCQWFNEMLWCLPSNSLAPLFLCLTSSSSQIQCKSARAIAMATESAILVCATASRDSTAWTAPKVLAVYKFRQKDSFSSV